jgi:hypothetical protein
MTSGSGDMPDDKFFVLIPQFRLQRFGNLVQVSPASAAEAYYALASLSASQSLNVEYAGFDMRDRRRYFAELADTVVVVNGGAGTFEEAFNTLVQSKRVITFPESGGAARVLEQIKTRGISRSLAEELKEKGLSLDCIRTDLIYAAGSVDEMLEQLSGIK